MWCEKPRIPSKFLYIFNIFEWIILCNYDEIIVCIIYTYKDNTYVCPIMAITPHRLFKCSNGKSRTFSLKCIKIKQSVFYQLKV